MIIRAASDADATGICKLANTVIADPVITFTTRLKDAAGVKRDIADRAPGFLVAEEAGTLIGFASYGPFRAGPGYARTRELSINLAADARGRGVGRVLVIRLQEIARQEGVHVLVAGISGSNAPAMAFHAALGFQQVGRMPEVGYKAGRWLDLVLMQKILLGGADTPDAGI